MNIMNKIDKRFLTLIIAYICCSIVIIPLFFIKYFNGEPEKKVLTIRDTVYVKDNIFLNKYDYKVSCYVERFKNVAIYEYGKYGVLPSIKLAQGILESASGGSYLCGKTNNHFGIKCFVNCNETNSFNMKDDYEWDRFKKYKTSWESFRDHSLLLEKERYENCKKCKKDYKCWALEIKKAGYATSKNYTKKIINIIEKYKLYRYD